MLRILRAPLALVAAALVMPGGALAATQVTGLRVALPTAGCTPSDCADLAVLNTLDGFNIQPRISVPFSAAIDTSTVSSSTRTCSSCRAACTTRTASRSARRRSAAISTSGRRKTRR
jgi:hypothetical protein